MSARRRLSLALALSLLAHALAFPFLVRGMTFKPPPPAKRPVVLTQLSRSQLAAMRAARAPGAAQPAPAQAKPPPPEPKTPERVKGQVVAVAPTKDTHPPEDTRFVSEFDTHVEKETAAKVRDPFAERVLPKKTDGAKSVAGAPAPPALAEAPLPLPLPARRRADPLDLRLNLFGDTTLGPQAPSAPLPEEPIAPPPPSDADGEAFGVPGGTGKGPARPGDLGQETGQLAGGPAADDLRGVEEGEGTFLNTRAWKYAGFMNRVKQRVAQIWIPSVQEATSRRDPTGHIYSYRDRETLVNVELDRTGKVSLVYVATSSGVEFLDRVAVEAFKTADAFPNPPNGLVDTDGHVRFAFGFNLETVQGGGVHFVGGTYGPGNSDYLPLAR